MGGLGQRNGGRPGGNLAGYLGEGLGEGLSGGSPAGRRWGLGEGLVEGLGEPWEEAWRVAWAEPWKGPGGKARDWVPHGPGTREPPQRPNPNTKISVSLYFVPAAGLAAHALLKLCMFI